MAELVLDPPLHFKRIIMFLIGGSPPINSQKSRLDGVRFEFHLKDEYKELLHHYVVTELIRAREGHSHLASNLESFFAKR